MRNEIIFEKIPPNQYAIKFTTSILKRLLNLHFNSWKLEKFKRFWIKRNNQSIRVAIDKPNFQCFNFIRIIVMKFV